MNKKISNKLLKIVKKNYQEIASDFNITRKKFIWPEIEKITQNIKDGDSVLDLGCGNGRLLEVLKDKKINYLGVDSSAELIKLAQENYPQYDFMVADILNLEEVINQKYDYIISIAVIHHLPGRKLRTETVEKIKKFLKKDGSFVFSVWRLWNNKKYKKLLLKNVFKKILLLNNLDFGDILFYWKDKNSQLFSERYYHAFTLRELKKTAKNFDINIDKYNYWASYKNLNK